MNYCRLHRNLVLWWQISCILVPRIVGRRRLRVRIGTLLGLMIRYLIMTIRGGGGGGAFMVHINQSYYSQEYSDIGFWDTKSLCYVNN